MNAPGFVSHPSQQRPLVLDHRDHRLLDAVQSLEVVFDLEQFLVSAVAEFVDGAVVGGERLLILLEFIVDLVHAEFEICGCLGIILGYLLFQFL